MAKRCLVCLAGLVAFVALSVPATAQESTVKGNLSGTVVDSSGSVVPGAQVTLSGAAGTKTLTTDAEGNFLFPLLVPGKYSVKVGKQGFKAASLPDVEILTNLTTSLRITLETGAVTETVVVSGTAVTVDTSSTAVGANLSDRFYEMVPLQRGVASLFYLAPGVVSGGAGGAANPSISGGSALENVYVADGVSITDTAFAGLGVFSRVYGSVATGINLSFIKEVQVKTGGFEPQYGKATGGIVQIVTKSGGNEYHGAISGFMQPTELEASRRNPDDPAFHNVNLFGKLLNGADYEVVGELGGHVPHFKDKLFFFGSFDPAERQFNVITPVNSGLFAHGPFLLRQLSYNYDGKLTYKLNDNHQVESSVFGDPTHTSRGPWRDLVRDNDTAFSKLEFGNRDWAVRYNGVLSPTWLVNASFSWQFNKFVEKAFPNLQEIIDDTQTAGLPGQRGEFRPVGLGFGENTEGNSFGASIDTSKTFHFLGAQTVTIGYRYDRAFFDGQRFRSGPTPPFPSTNASGNSNKLTSAADAFGTPTNFDWLLLLAPNTCTLCPFMQIPGITGNGPNGMSRVLLKATRSEFGLNSAGTAAFETSSIYHTVYVNDSWSPNKYVTINVGLRWEQERVNGQVFQYSFTDNWSPRVGVAVDPWGNRKNKIYASFGRYSYALPLDVAERSLTQEADVFGFRTAPDFTLDANGNRIATINQFGTVTPVVEPGHVLNGATGGVSNSVAASTQAFLEPISPGTRLSYEDEFVVGFEHQFPQGVVFTAKYLRRDLKRIIEDTGGISPEAALAGVNQQFVITNVGKSTDVFVNPSPFDFTPVFSGGVVTNAPAQCGALDFFLFPVTNSVGQNVTDSNGNTGVCFQEDANGNSVGADGVTPVGSGSDGLPDGFANPVRQYWAVEFEVNKSFSKNWQLRANWRIAKLFGNFEGALRNDNGQTDPGISSLFDFTEGNFNLLGDQFRPGVLNTDRFHVINGYFTYVFDKTMVKGLTLGTGVKVQTGTPINRTAAHPVYENSGEVPLGARGILGRLPVTGTVDFHGDYPFRITERTSLRVGIDLFNIAFARRNTFLNQNIDLTFGVPNADFLHPNNQNGVRANDAFQAPFQARAFVKFSF